jgi:hypothetical protein
MTINIVKHIICDITTILLLIGYFCVFVSLFNTISSTGIILSLTSLLLYLLELLIKRIVSIINSLFIIPESSIFTEIKKLVDDWNDTQVKKTNLKKEIQNLIKEKKLEKQTDSKNAFKYYHCNKDGKDVYIDTDYRRVFYDDSLKLFYYEYQDKNNKYRYYDTSFYPFYQAFAFDHVRFCSDHVRVYYDEENNTVYIYNEEGNFIKTEDYEVAFRFIKK